MTRRDLLHQARLAQAAEEKSKEEGAAKITAAGPAVGAEAPAVGANRFRQAAWMASSSHKKTHPIDGFLHDGTAGDAHWNCSAPRRDQALASCPQSVSGCSGFSTGGFAFLDATCFARELEGGSRRSVRSASGSLMPIER